MKGQNLRLFVGAKCIAAATSCQVHIGTQTEDDTTKDTTGDWSSVEVTGKSWDASAECQFQTSGDTTGLSTKEIIAMVGTEVTIKFQTTSGTNNRTAGTQILSGTAIITDLSISSQNRQTVTASVQFTGKGALS